MNKYQSYIDSYHDRSSGLDSHLDFDIKRSLPGTSEIYEGEKWERSAFFMHYKVHSQQLTNAFQEWINLLVFATCEYSGGEFYRYNRRLAKPKVRFMNFMQFHLDIAYKECFPDPDIIQSKRNEICDKISNLMIGQMPYRPSFEMIITARINTNCSSLKQLKNQDLVSNMYVHTLVCNIIFEVITGRRMLALTVKTMYPDKECDLIHRNVTTIARGDEQSILKLKSTLEELIMDTQIRDIVDQYNKLRNILDNDDQEAKLRQFADNLLTVIQGGKLLGGFHSCELCLPGELSEVSI